MDEWHRVAELLDEITQTSAIPSASIAVRSRGELLLHHTAGTARLSPPRAAILDQPYDLASLTKPLAGSLALAMLLESDRLSLDDTAARWVDGIDPRITVRQLCHHASGLPAWAPLHEGVPRERWGSASARREIICAASRVPLHSEPGTTYTYSDLGFLVLLDIIETVGGQRLDAQLSPLFQQIAGDGLRWGCSGAAATEDRPDRGGVIEGEVHDPIAFAMGGVSSHAGLFGTARAVAALAEAVLDTAAGRSHALPARGIAMLWADRGPGRHRGGWDIAEPGASTGRYWPEDGRGHLGYTGTSVWMSERQRVIVALLTNRVHPTDELRTIRTVRPQIHEAVARALRWDREHPP